MKILITGFDPFGGEETNPSEEVLRLLPEIPGAEIRKRVLPTVFGIASSILCDAVEAFLPDAVVCLGQAGGRAGITVERVAINVRDASLPDNLKKQPEDETIAVDGETAYFATLPIKAIVKAIDASGLKASISNTAGTFVCNDVLYSLLHFARKNYPHMKCGFIHLPYTFEQVRDKPAGTEFMYMENILRGVQIAIETIIKEA